MLDLFFDDNIRTQTHMIKLHKKKKSIQNYRWIQLINTVTILVARTTAQSKNTPPRVHLVPVWVCHMLHSINVC